MKEKVKNIFYSIKRILKKTSLTSIIFFIVSIISLTFAWIGYRGVSNTSGIELEVLSWHIEIGDDETDIDVNVFDVVPGMAEYKKEIDVSNDGDISAKLSYKIKEIRVFDDVYKADTEEEMNEIIESFPFTIDITTNPNIVSAGSTGKYVITVNWPYDSADDEKDTDWGERAYQFKNNEKALHQADSSYVIRPTLYIKLELIAKQYETMNFKVNGTQLTAQVDSTWGEYIEDNKTGPSAGGGLYVSDGCGLEDSQIINLSTPYNSDTRANDRYCAIYQNSTELVGGLNKRKRLVSSDNAIQKYSDGINAGENYSFSYSFDTWP